jgi:sortase system peptidoglycan-associated protein
MKYSAIALTLSLIISHAFAPMANAATPKKTSSHSTTQNDLVGFGSGALLGSAVGGPVGGLIGGIMGLFISNDVNNDNALAQAKSELKETKLQLLALQRAPDALKPTGQIAGYEIRSYQTASIENPNRAAQQNTTLINKSSYMTPIETNIQFRTGSHRIESHYHRQLDLIAALIRQSTDLQITLAGYADERGDSNYNQALSQQRAISVKSYLTKQQVPTAQLHTESFGETKMNAIESQPDGWFFARKVTLSIHPTSQTPLMAASATK